MSRASAADNPYRILGVDPDAPLRAIKQAYRRIAFETHPDRRPDDPEAAERFRRASRAYDLLRDEDRRRRYDRLGTNGDPAVLYDLELQLDEAVEIFARAFGSEDVESGEAVAPAPTSHAPLPLKVTFEDVERGGERRLPRPCGLCQGSGARDGSVRVRCTTCGGSGRLRQVEEGFLGPKLRTEECTSCRGTGRRPMVPCAACDGSGTEPGGGELVVRIPRGVREGDSLATVDGQGPALVARLADDPRWARDGATLYVNAQIPYETAVLGGDVEIELPGRRYAATIPAGTPSGHRLRIPDQGLPLPDREERGDLVATLQVRVPKRVGAVEGWMLQLRRRRAAVDQGGLAGLQARAWAATRRRWAEWKESYHRATIDRVEAAAESLRTAAAVVRDTDATMGPLLEEAYQAIAPEAARARRRLNGLAGQEVNRAVAGAVVNLLLGAPLAAALWWTLTSAGTMTEATGTTGWWALLQEIDPLVLALLPFLGGLAAGALETTSASRPVRALVSAPIVLGVMAAGLAAGWAGHLLLLSTLDAVDSWRRIALPWMLGAIGVVVTLAAFMLGAALVHNIHQGLAKLLDREDRRLLRRYDSAASSLGARLEEVGHAFRQLLVRAEDDSHPVTSLLTRAAEALSAGPGRRPGPGSLPAAAALLRGVVIVAAWTATSAAAARIAALSPVEPAWLRATAVVAVLTLCAVGTLVPRPYRARTRAPAAVTTVAVLVGLLAVVGMLVVGGDGWLGAAAAVAALALSFQLASAAKAATVMVALAATGSVALLLAPFAVVLGARRGRG